jgi:hypothetical protein
MPRLLWTQKQDIGPRRRYQHAMAYDAARARVVLFGGIDVGLTVSLGDTWEWDGQIWIQVSDFGPAPRSRHAMAYDAGRHRLVLFGGLTGFGDNLKTLADTWEWNGEYWMQVADTGPSERHDTAMAYDASIGRVVLYGGSGLGSTQTWEWDGEAWTQTESEIGPGQRIGHAMAYDEVRKRLVLFGGEPLQQGEATGTNDTWERNGAVWARVADTGPERTHFPAMAFDSKRVILFGGRAGSGSTAYTSGATWQWDGKHWAQRGDFGPGPRFALAMAYDGARDRVVLFGGIEGQQALGDTWELAEYPTSS